MTTFDKLVPALLSRRFLMRALAVAGGVALAGWLLWWGASVQQYRAHFGNLSWIPVWPTLGLDLSHNYLAARLWVDGGDPYMRFFGDVRGLFSYPPLVLALFSWAGLVDNASLATGLWGLFIVGAGALSLWQVQVYRTAQGQALLPYLAVLGLLVWSAPFYFAIERGNCDVFVLVFMAGAAFALAQPQQRHWDAVAGALLALAVAVKIYPLVALFVMLAMRRYAAALFAVAFLVLLALSWGDTFHQWIANSRSLQGDRIGPFVQFFDWLQGGGSAAHRFVPMDSRNIYYWGSMHSPGDWWPFVWQGLGVRALTQWPLLLVQILTLGPLTAYACWKLFRTGDPARHAVPIMLWALALATFWMPLSYDYNLIYLPILLYAVWAARDAYWVWGGMALALLWLLPFGPVTYEWGMLRVVAKLLSLYLATWLLIRRLRETDASPA